MEPGALRRRLDDIYLRGREHVSPNLPETQPVSVEIRPWKWLRRALSEIARDELRRQSTTESLSRAYLHRRAARWWNGCIENRVLVSVEVACDCTDCLSVRSRLRLYDRASRLLLQKIRVFWRISMWGALSSIKISSRWMHVFETGHAALRISRRDAASCRTRLSETQLPFRFQTCAVFCSCDVKTCAVLAFYWLCRSLQHYTKAVTYECCSMTFISSTTQTFLFLTSSTWWHRALLQASADISHYIQGFWWMFFGLGVNQITGMCPALCYALRLALLSHDVSLRFQNIISCWSVTGFVCKLRPVKAPVCNGFCL